jgi:hypothetical protein
MTTSEMLAALVTKFAQRIHFLLAAAQNLPYKEGDVCDECLLHARDLAALATPSVASPQSVRYCGHEAPVGKPCPVCYPTLTEAEARLDEHRLIQHERCSDSNPCSRRKYLQREVAKRAAPVGEPGRTPMDQAKQRVELADSIMKLPYIKAVRNTTTGQERFVARDDVVTAIHEYAKRCRAAASPAQGAPTPQENEMSEAKGGVSKDMRTLRKENRLAHRP